LIKAPQKTCQHFETLFREKQTDTLIYISVMFVEKKQYFGYGTWQLASVRFSGVLAH